MIGAAKIADWDSYAKSFLTVFPSEMLVLNREAVSWMTGDMADFGCGSGKVIPIALDQSQVSSYVGIDMSVQMVKNARMMAGRFPGKKCSIIQGSIESVVLRQVDSALSINSYYTWPNPEIMLSHIHNQLKGNGVFVLATINPSIDMPALLTAAEKELIAHPHWNEFRQHNLDICTSRQVNFVDLDDLINQVRSVGFRVVEAHQRLYGGGLNFLVLKKN